MEDRLLDLDSLRTGLPTLIPEVGSFYSVAGVFCLDSQKHQSGVSLTLLHNQPDNYIIVWERAIDDALISSFQDEHEATEFGATSIALLLTLKLKPHNTVERAVRSKVGFKTGFDYWAGEKLTGNPFARKARLEISGIRCGTKKDVLASAKRKNRQASVSDHLGYPKYIVIVEFSKPQAIFEES